MLAMRSRRSASLSIRRISAQQTFYCYRELKPDPGDLWLSQDCHKKNLEGVDLPICKNKFAAAFWPWMTAAKSTSKSAQTGPTSPEIASFKNDSN
jgi:hypothetical protein